MACFLNGLLAMLFFITKKELISENNNIVEKKISFSLIFPRENVIFLKKIAALSSEIISYSTFRLKPLYQIKFTRKFYILSFTFTQELEKERKKKIKNWEGIVNMKTADFCFFLFGKRQIYCSRVFFTHKKINKCSLFRFIL
jgi:hypothetical protein